MPASLYRLVGRQHPVDQPVAVDSSAPVVEAVEPVVEAVEPVVEAVEPVATAQVEQAVEVVEETVSVIENDIPTEPEPVAPVYPNWDATWTKTKLFGIATDLGLAVTIDSTKAEIIAALAAATRS
jgi:hypothetical protein